MQNIITQVSQDGSNGSPLLHQNSMGSENPEYYEGLENDAYGNSLIHLNIQENHYFITRDQLMSLPESLLLCLFPSGVFLDRDGQVITNLTPDDEVYIMNFPPDCFEYIMEIFTKAHDDMINYPVEKLFQRNSSNNNLVNSAKGFFGFNNGSNLSSSSSSSPNEHNILHQKPAIIVLREDLDYYCVPQQQFKFESSNSNSNNGTTLDPETIRENNNDLLHHFMAQIKIAAGSYLAGKTSVFQGLFSSNRLRYQNQSNKNQNSATIEDLSKLSSKKLGPAEQHLMDMLCSSGFTTKSLWGNRTQEAGKTVISSLSLCRLANESTEEFRNIYNDAKKIWETEHGLNNDNQSDINLSTTVSATSSVVSTSHNSSSKGNNRTSNGLKNSTTSSDISALSGSKTNNNNELNSNNNGLSRSPRKEKKKSRFSALADNVRSHSSSRNNSQLRLGNNSHSKHNHSPELPKVYDLVPKPDINEKLLLFWRKPARKCWWGDEEIDLQVDIYGSWVDDKHTTIKLKLPSMTNTEAELNKISVPVRLHIRRVWTLELSVIGVQ